MANRTDLDDNPGDGDFARVARERLARVLGAEAGAAVYRDALAAAGLTRLDTADDLYTLASTLVRSGGFVGVLGASLQIFAVLRGARAR